MTIQLPILLWTVISFSVLMLLLNKLLFAPLLTFMDERQEKINRAKAAGENARQAQEDARHAAEEARQAAQTRARDDAAAALDTAHSAAVQDYARQEQAYRAQLAQTKTDVEMEKTEILQRLNADMNGLVFAFIEKLVQ